MSLVKEFNDYRSRLNEVILSKNNLVMKRLWNLDKNTYENGSLDTKTKEMLGLVVPPKAGYSVAMIASSITPENAMN